MGRKKVYLIGTGTILGVHRSGPARLWLHANRPGGGQVGPVPPGSSGFNPEPSQFQVVAGAAGQLRIGPRVPGLADLIVNLTNGRGIVGNQMTRPK
jgi:hypothetical protein